MKFEEILPGLIAGRRARMRKRALYEAASEYVRLGPWRADELEIVLEYKDDDARTSLYIRPFLLTRRVLERDDWEFVDDVKSQGGTR